tara:strand:+ start:1929 stop:2900 length:972 start_codon:yes stop_codon:yes gene_type:complete
MAKRGDNPGNQPRSTFYVVGSAVLAALVLGLAAFYLIRGFQWRSALSELRAEPGIEVMAVERVGFIKRRLLGLRDPLAPPAENILRSHGIAPHTVEIELVEYHSTNTAYTLQRKAEAAANAESLQDDLISAAGKFTKTINSQRASDIEHMTRMLFESKFPKAMEEVEMKRINGDWEATGELYGPDLDHFAENASHYIIDGELKLDGLVDLTNRRTTEIETDIGNTNLLVTDIDGNLVHIDRMIRLVSHYDEVCELSKMPVPSLRLEIQSANPDSLSQRIETIQEMLKSSDTHLGDRFSPNAFVYSYSDDGPGIYLKLLPGSAP